MSLGSVFKYVPSDFWITEDYVYILTKMRTSLICVNRQSGDIDYLNSIVEQGDANSQYSSMALYKNKWIMVPRYSNYIIIYDINKKKNKRIDMSVCDVKWGKTSDIYIIDQIAYLTPERDSDVIVLDCDKEKIITQTKIITGALNQNDCCVWRRSLYIPDYNKDQVFRVSDGGKSIDVLSGAQKIVRIMATSDSLYYLDSEKSLFIFVGNHFEIRKEYIGNGDVFVVNNTLIQVDYKNRRITDILSNKQVVLENSNEFEMLGVRVRNGLLFILGYNEGKLIVINCDENLVINKEVFVTEEFERAFGNDNMVIETKLFNMTLENFIKRL